MEAGFEMHLINKGDEWHFRMKIYLGVDYDVGQIYSVVKMATNVNDLVKLLSSWMAIKK